MKPILYHHGMSVCAAKVRMALAEKGVVPELRYVDIRKGEQHHPDYLKLNPNAVVPTLVYGDDVVIESTVICEYVDDAFEGPALKPASPSGRARMRLWTKQLDEGVHFPATAVISFALALAEGFKKRFASPEDLRAHIRSLPNPKRREFLTQTCEQGVEAPLVVEAVRRFDKLLSDMEKALALSPWLAGDAFSLADIAYAPYMARLECLRMDWLWAQRPRVADWYRRLSSRPAYKPSIVDWFDEDEVRLMAENGARYREKLAAALMAHA